jgi:prevent-host-death family protein
MRLDSVLAGEIEMGDRTYELAVWVEDPAEAARRGYSPPSAAERTAIGFAGMADSASVEAGQLEAELPGLLERVARGHQRITITRNGQAIAALVSAEDLEELEAVEQGRDMAALREARAEWEAEGRTTKSLQELARELKVKL